MENPNGTLTLGTSVIVGGRERTVTLATFRIVTRDECEGHIEEFCSENPQYRRGLLFATWVVRECIPIRRNYGASAD